MYYIIEIVTIFSLPGPFYSMRSVLLPLLLINCYCTVTILIFHSMVKPHPWY